MKSRFRTNNFIAILIAIFLIATGFTLGFVHKRSTAEEEKKQARQTSSETAYTGQIRASGDSLSQVALIHESHGGPTDETTAKSEMDLVRESIDWSDAPSPEPELVRTDDYDVYINVTREYLVYVFNKLGYTGENIDSGETVAIPPLLVVSIRKGWADEQTVQFRNSMFYRVILSLILYENDAVLRERGQLMEILEDRGVDGSFSAENMRQLLALAYSYRVITDESAPVLNEVQLQELLARVDMVPPSLALAQAAHESGYATTRRAHSANALFGQWDWSENAVKPQQQRKGMGNYGIRSFNQPIDSVRAYIWNLNTHHAYAGFRKERATQRGLQAGRITLDSKRLADTLTSYSEQGTSYTEELKNTISYNRLERADKLRLMAGEPIYFH